MRARDPDGAEDVLFRMAASGQAPDIHAYTILLRAYVPFFLFTTPFHSIASVDTRHCPTRSRVLVRLPFFLMWCSIVQCSPIARVLVFGSGFMTGGVKGHGRGRWIDTYIRTCAYPSLLVPSYLSYLPTCPPTHLLNYSPTYPITATPNSAT